MILRIMSKSAAMTYAADGIRVNSAQPELVNMPLTDTQAPDLDDAVIAATPMKHGGTPVVVAHGCLFLASDELSFVAGAGLAIDDGSLAQ